MKTPGQLWGKKLICSCGYSCYEAFDLDRHRRMMQSLDIWTCAPRVAS